MVVAELLCRDITHSFTSFSNVIAGRSSLLQAGTGPVCAGWQWPGRICPHARVWRTPSTAQVQPGLSWRCGMAGFSQESLFIVCGHATARRCSLTKAHQAWQADCVFLPGSRISSANASDHPGAFKIFPGYFLKSSVIKKPAIRAASPAWRDVTISSTSYFLIKVFNTGNIQHQLLFRTVPASIFCTLKIMFGTN